MLLLEEAFPEVKAEANKNLEDFIQNDLEIFELSQLVLFLK